MPSATLLSYSHHQQKALFWAGKPTDVIGITGSIYLCYCILKDRDGLKKKVFRRLFLAVTLAHIILVCIHVLSTIPTPEGSFYGSLGSRQSCSAIGFLSHIAYTMTMVYNGSIGIYYYIVFTYNWSDQTIKQKAEPVFHAIAAIYPILGPIFGLAFGMYNADPILLQCYAAPAPLGCGEVDGILCERGHRFRGLFVWLTGFVELNLGTGIKLGAVFKILITVWLQQRKNKKRFDEGISDGGVRRSTAVEASQKIPQKQPERKKMTKTTALIYETFWQSIWFVLSCFIPYCVGLIVKMVDLFWTRIPEDRKAPGWLFILTFISNVLFPMQGVFNTLIYLRPNFMRRRRTHGGKESVWQCAKATVYTAAGFDYQGNTKKSKKSTELDPTSLRSSRESATMDHRSGLKSRTSIRSSSKRFSADISSSNQPSHVTTDNTSVANGLDIHQSRLVNEATEMKESFSQEIVDDACDGKPALHGNGEIEQTRRTASEGHVVPEEPGRDEEVRQGPPENRDKMDYYDDDEPSLPADGHLSGLFEPDDSESGA
ncbi:unknown protein [Seminavis robusta]|uniref:Uncharacterized protein n=1 Tax=Seminavis robusta TaxID=568900 RepID=A0A9N8EVS3_9STRA|nr:unknown protein [Seminavis robusta]|eukprot:Sro2160_g317060.1 n/a (543) ;mRNA; f:7378-9094